MFSSKRKSIDWFVYEWNIGLKPLSANLTKWWRAVLTEDVHRVCKNIWFLYVCMLCFHVCTRVCFHLISNVHIVRTFVNRIPFQTFEKCHNVSYRYVSYVKSETSYIWRTGAWFLKSFGERVEENHIYDLAKPNSTVRARTVYKGCNVPSFFGKWKKWL